MHADIPPRFREADQPHIWSPEGGMRYVVRCPACDGRAAVAPEPGEPGRRAVRLACERCGYVRSSTQDGVRWLGPVLLYAGGRCASCGLWVGRALGRRPRLPAARSARVRCAGCGHVTAFPLRAERAGGEAADPYFGRPLWYQAPCAGHTLWAWNEAHVTFLRNYVGAALREREPNQNRSLASRLPTWIKDAKHRDAVLACLAAFDAGPGRPSAGAG